MIGGEHYLLPPGAVSDNMFEMLESLAGKTAFFATARDALASLLRTLPCSTIYLPDLICHSVYQACRHAGKEVRTYRIAHDFVNTDTELKVARSGESCMLVMHYFGVTNENLVNCAKSLGMTLISDVTHMLFNRERMNFLSARSDYLVASLRKSGPFPDGAFISSRHHSVPHPRAGLRVEFLSLRSAGLLSRGFSAKEEFSNDENYLLLRKAETLLDQSQPGDFECTYLSRQLLRTIAVAESAQKISRNISALSSRLMGICRTVSISTAPSPYYICIFLKKQKRDFVRVTLARHRYFLPIHWDTSQMPEPSLLSDLILSIPCDARYNETDMQAVAEIIESCLNHQEYPS